MIPENWLIDANGKPTSDGSLYPANASLAPMAGHKGYGFGLWCEILSGALPGGHMTWDVGSWMFDPTDTPSYHNAGFIVIDTKVIAEQDDYAQRMNKLIDEIHAVETAGGRGTGGPSRGTRMGQCFQKSGNRDRSSGRCSRETDGNTGIGIRGSDMAGMSHIGMISDMY